MPLNFNNFLYCLQGEHFPFLGLNQSVNDLRFRTVFYTALGRLLMVDLGEDEDKFHTFMVPLTGKAKSYDFRIAVS